MNIFQTSHWHKLRQKSMESKTQVRRNVEAKVLQDRHFLTIGQELLGDYKKFSFHSVQMRLER